MIKRVVIITGLLFFLGLLSVLLGPLFSIKNGQMDRKIRKEMIVILLSSVYSSAKTNYDQFPSSLNKLGGEVATLTGKKIQVDFYIYNTNILNSKTAKQRRIIVFENPSKFSDSIFYVGFEGGLISRYNTSNIEHLLSINNVTNLWEQVNKSNSR